MYFVIVYYLFSGDSAYGLNSYMLTPKINPLTRAENLYNEFQIRTRNSVERLFGVLKRRFPILAYGLRVKLETVLKIIVATAVLHNICINNKEEVPPLPEEIDIERLNYLITAGEIPYVAPFHAENVTTTRNLFINNYFHNL